ncbi:ArnT family glycosyltransferase [Arthrobacter sp. B6]|uniref:ArnT family glycosyltransferase n=1 Tax=Arthrobacter sp. B6 TaxID=1570137 RepID=UPI0009EED132|nr:glycosyltransferase family 39 protein [Arthrobacter sp. B6]
MASLFTASLPKPGLIGEKTQPDSWWIRRWPEMLLAVISGSVYFWDLTINGWGNPYYAAAAQAGAADWVALVFGSADAGNGATVDKPPLHLWVLALSVKALGLSSMSVLAPQALMGVATAWLVQRTAMVWGSRRQAFLAGLFVVLTPVTSMMFRFNNPDALLLLLWALVAFFAVRAVEQCATRFLYLAAFLLGIAFLCKQFQSWIFVPAIALAFMVFGYDRLWTRLRRLSIAALIMVSPATFWITLVESTPPSQRPWIGGSNSNSFLELTFGYNGFGRLTGQPGLGAVNPKDFDGVVGHDASLLRLVTINYAPEVAWFLPVALLGAAIMLSGLLKRQYNRLEAFSAALTVIWFLTTFAVLSFMTGDIHPYYTSMVALPMAVLSAHTFEIFWVNRSSRAHLRGAALLALLCVFLGSGILTWFQDWHPWAGFTVKVAGLAAVTILCLPSAGNRLRLTSPALTIAGLTVVLIPLLFIFESISTPQQGSFPISGPVPTAESWHKRDADQLINAEKENYALARGEPVIPRISALIERAPLDARWAAATTGSENAALYQLSTKRPVMSIGGFSALDAYPKLATFQEYVADGKVRYYIHQPGILTWSASPNTLAVVAWIEGNFGFEEIDGVRLYDLRHQVG